MTGDVRLGTMGVSPRQMLSLLVAGVFIFVGVQAITPQPGAVPITLFDGSTIMVRTVGDQFGFLNILEETGNIVVPVVVDDATEEDGAEQELHFNQSNAKKGKGKGNTVRWDYHFADVDSAGFPKSTGVWCLFVTAINSVIPCQTMDA